MKLPPARFIRTSGYPKQARILNGSYSPILMVTITANEWNAQIHYTVDGIEPAAASPTYTGLISIATTQVLKASVFSNFAAILPGLIEFHTYFINEEHDLPVVSVAWIGSPVHPPPMGIHPVG